MCIQVEAIIAGDAAGRWLFPCLKDVCATQHSVDMKQFEDKITGLLQGFEQRFQIFEELEKEFKVFAGYSLLMPLICLSTSNLK